MSKIILSVDDGCASDVRVADLAERYEIPVTFYWPVEWHSLAYDNGYEPLRYGDACDIARDFSIGSHTITHRHLTKISLGEACYEIELSKDLLQEIFDVDIDSFAAPRGYMTEELTEFASQFYKHQRLTKGGNLVHVHPNSGGNENQEWREFARAKMKLFDEIELWFHSHELDRFDLWDQLEEFLKANV